MYNYTTFPTLGGVNYELPEPSGNRERSGWGLVDNAGVHRANR